MKDYSNYYPSTKVVDTSGVLLVDRNTTRNTLTLYNQSTTTSVKIYFNGDDDKAAFIVLDANAGLDFKPAPMNAVYAYTDAGTATLTVWEA